MYWLEVSVVTDGEGAEAVADALRPFAYQESVVLEQLGDLDDLAPDALERAITVKIFLPGEEDTPALRQRIEEILYFLGRLYPLPPPSFQRIEDKDWAQAWKAHYHPFRIGKRIVIRPSWYQDHDGAEPITSRKDDLVIIMDPGMAFGTGTHPTTQMCVMALEQLVQPATRVLDVGTGSAILALAAARLGAERVLGIDRDELAVTAASANVTQNGLGRLIEIRPGTLADVAESPWDVVVVNILPDVIMALLVEGDLMGHLAAAGTLVLSGIIGSQADQIVTAVTDAGGIVVRRLTMGDWVALLVRHRAGN